MANTLELGNGKWATGKDTVLAFNDENNNFKPLPFDFTRDTVATVVNKAGLIETVGSGEPRIDFSNDAKGALLLEPTRSNLVTYSEDFSQFTGGGSIVIESGYLAPDGTNSAYKVSGSAGALNMGLGLTNSETRSIYAKTISGQGNAHLCSYFGNTNNLKTITEDWQRFEVNGTTTETGVTSFYAVDFRGSTDLNEIIIWGAQAEQGSYATSYIPTQGSAATRSADNAYQQSVTQVIGQSEGTMFIEFIPKDSSTLQILYQAKSSSGVVGQVDIRLQSGLIRALANDGGGSQFFMNGGSYTVGTKYKVAVRYKLNDSKLYINGTDITGDTTCSFTGSSLDQVSFAESLSSFLPSVDIVDARLYNTALTNAELQALTT